MNSLATLAAIIAAIKLSIYFFVTQSDTTLGVVGICLIGLFVMFFIFAIQDDIKAMQRSNDD